MQHTIREAYTVFDGLSDKIRSAKNLLNLSLREYENGMTRTRKTLAGKIEQALNEQGASTALANLKPVAEEVGVKVVQYTYDSIVSANDHRKKQLSQNNPVKLAAELTQWQNLAKQETTDYQAKSLAIATQKQKLEFLPAFSFIKKPLDKKGNNRFLQLDSSSNIRMLLAPPTGLFSKLFASAEKKEGWRMLEEISQKSGGDPWVAIVKAEEATSALKALPLPAYEEVSRETQNSLNTASDKVKAYTKLQKQIKTDAAIQKEWGSEVAGKLADLDSKSFPLVATALVAGDVKEDWLKDYASISSYTRMSARVQSHVSAVNKLDRQISDPLAKLSRAKSRQPSKRIEIDLAGIQKSVLGALATFTSAGNAFASLHPQLREFERNRLPESARGFVGSRLSDDDTSTSYASSSSSGGFDFGHALLLYMLLSSDSSSAKADIGAATGLGNIPDTLSLDSVSEKLDAGMSFKESISVINMPGFDADQLKGVDVGDLSSKSLDVRVPDISVPDVSVPSFTVDIPSINVIVPDISIPSVPSCSTPSAPSCSSSSSSSSSSCGGGGSSCASSS